MESPHRLLLNRLPDVFAVVQSSAATFGVVPFENSSNGPVIDTLDFLTDREEGFPDIQVCGEAYIYIQHCLLGYVAKSAYQGDLSVQKSPSGSATPLTGIPSAKEPRSKPLSDLGHVKRVYSHPQAFGQSEIFLSTHLKCAERHEVSSTSEAATISANDESGEAAAISSKLAANFYGLSILGEGIQDVSDNTTRFLIIQKGANDDKKQMLIPEKFRGPAALDSNRKTLVVFNVNHESKGALINALLVFHNHGLNLTSIDKRPSRILPWHYNFLAEFEGRKELQDPDLLHLALEELETTTEGNRWLGCWLDRLRR